MAEFTYNNAKHVNTGYTLFELNYRYHQCIFYKENIDLRSGSKAANELTKKLRNLIVVCKENLKHVQKMQKQAYDKRTKPRNYTLEKKV